MFPISFRASQVVLVVNNPLANAGNVRDEVWSLGQEDPLEKGMATHYSILAWRIQWREDPGRLQSTGSQSQTRLSASTFTLETHGELNY